VCTSSCTRQQKVCEHGIESLAYPCDIEEIAKLDFLRASGTAMHPVIQSDRR
jgi:hypothetical protein